LIPGLRFQGVPEEVACIVCSSHHITNLPYAHKRFGITGVLAEKIHKNPKRIFIATLCNGIVLRKVFLKVMFPGSRRTASS